MPISGAAILLPPCGAKAASVPRGKLRGRGGWSPCYAIKLLRLCYHRRRRGPAALFFSLSKHRQDFSTRFVSPGPALGLLALVGVQGDLTSLQPSREDCKRAALLWAVNRETGEVVVIPLASVVELNP